MPPKLLADQVGIAVSGIGIASGFGHGKALFREGLFEAPNLFSYLQRETRQAADGESPFIGIEMPPPPDILPRRIARTASLSGATAVSVVTEAWQEANLDAIDPDRIGLVVGGSNLMSREQALAFKGYADRRAYIPPRHGHMFLDTDICGLCTSIFAIRGFAYTTSAASASGTLAIVQAMDAIRAGKVDVCIALGAFQDVSGHDLQAMRALGAMGSSKYATVPSEACRPMDRNHDGFIYGEACAALVLTRTDKLAGLSSYGTLLGAGFVSDGTRGPEPNPTGQIRAAKKALAEAGLKAEDIDYVNGHATGTPTGDMVELETYRALGLGHARINATKSIIGHGLSAAGTVEVAATLLQIEAGRLHPTRNLQHPLDPNLRWVGAKAETHALQTALKFSFGFGGMNAALVIGRPG
ncbi:beta-ketoacyl synthase N-terminal-like domain-containing protein [Roseibium sp.]|uniref:beta-ketoacyl synthase N-terminal-like domain-containing protein n=1 Tax=Roseibium sp. TaxID=1936156 RepID=UPI003A979FD1